MASGRLHVFANNKCCSFRLQAQGVALWCLWRWKATNQLAREPTSIYLQQHITSGNWLNKLHVTNFASANEFPVSGPSLVCWASATKIRTLAIRMLGRQLPHAIDGSVSQPPAWVAGPWNRIAFKTIHELLTPRSYITYSKLTQGSVSSEIQGQLLHCLPELNHVHVVAFVLIPTGLRL